jgi:hypothetical protein
VACDARWFSELKRRGWSPTIDLFLIPYGADQLAGVADLADMEGAAVARVARLYGIPCAMIKGISDSADETGRQDVASHIDWVSERIADALVHELAINPTDK